MELTAEQRLQLIQVLPTEAGSLREATKVKRLRDELNLSEDEKEQISLDQETGSFDPEALNELPSKDIHMDDIKKRLVAYGFIQREDSESVPTNDTFVDLMEMFADEISAAKDELTDE